LIRNKIRQSYQENTNPKKNQNNKAKEELGDYVDFEEIPEEK
jgi:hypothetical protein